MEIGSRAIVAETFGMAAREWRALLAWIAIHVVVALAILAAVRPAMQARIAAALQGATQVSSPAIFWVIAPVALLLAVLLYNAAFRAVLRPGERPAAFVRLGMDELRLVALTLLLACAFYLLLVLASFATILLASLIGHVLAIDPASPAALGVILAALVPPALALLYLAVRLSPAAPLTLLAGKLMIGPAWRLTRGATLPLLRAYATVALVLAVAYALLVAATMWPTLAALGTPDPVVRRWRLLVLEQAEWGRGLGRLSIATIAGGLIGGLMVALQGGVLAVATRRLLARPESAYAARSPLREG